MGSEKKEQTKKQMPGHRLAQRLELSGKPNRLMAMALTHPSYMFEHPDLGHENNQRLEFLGDAIVDFVVAEYLYQNYPDRLEGELTKMRAAVVNEATLSWVARNIDLGQELLLGRGEQLSGGRERPSILADAWESVTGAIYLQFGLQEARRVILEQLIPYIEEIAKGNYGDYKTQLQEEMQRLGIEVQYKILAEEGPDHNKRFTAGVFLHAELKEQGEGRTKKEAEQNAAQRALDNLVRDQHG
ncbi:MAG: ribonuclease III [Peptococcaceae bacterium]|nr:ribonuclease III [Peptococcaceae bacterium]